MKKHLLLFIIATISFNESKAQYHPMISDTTEWCLAWNITLVRSPTRIFEFQKMTAEGDTLIDSVLYKIVYTDVMPYYGAIREDTTSQKVFFMNSGDTVEYLLYDFSLNLGDTMNIDLINNPYGNMYDGNYIVDSVGSITIRGGLRKYIRLHNSININLASDGKPLKLEWIESVGDIHNPIYTNGYDGFGYSGMNWACANFHESAILKQTFNSGKNYVDACSAMSVSGLVYSDTCHIDYLGGIEELNKSITLSVYPNPTNGNSIVIDVNNYILKNNSIVLITDAMSKQVYSKTIVPSENSIRLTDVKLTNGIYFVTLTDDKTAFGKTKLVIEN